MKQKGKSHDVINYCDWMSDYHYSLTAVIGWLINVIYKIYMIIEVYCAILYLADILSIACYVNCHTQTYTHHINGHFPAEAGLASCPLDNKGCWSELFSASPIDSVCSV